MQELTADRQGQRARADAARAGCEVEPGEVVAVTEPVTEPNVNGDGYRRVVRVRRFISGPRSVIQSEAGAALARLLSG